MEEILARFGGGTTQRQAVTERLQRIYHLAQTSGRLDRFVIYGSYITAKPEPGDVDIFLVMSEEFEVNDYVGELRELFHISQHMTVSALASSGSIAAPASPTWKI